MATIATAKDYNRWAATWADLTTAGNAAIVRYAPKVSMVVASVQVTGTFGGATVTILGSNDGTNYVAIKDKDGAAEQESCDTAPLPSQGGQCHQSARRL